MSKGGVLAAGAVAAIEDFPVAMSWAPDGSAVVIGGGEGGIFIVGMRDGVVRRLGDHAPGVLQVAYQPRSFVLASAGQDGSVRLWDAGAVEAQASRIIHRAKGWPLGLSWRSDGGALVFASGKSLHVHEATSGAMSEIVGHAVTLSHALWRGRNEVIAAGNGALFVDSVSESKVEQFVLEGTPLTLSLSPDMKIAASGLADGTINFRYINNRKRSRMSGYDGKVDQTAWSANSRYLATSSSGASSIVVWDFGSKGPEGSAPLQLNAHEERIEALDWQGSGAMLASAGRDWRVVLWRPAPNSREPLDIQLLDGAAAAVSWSPDSKHLAVAQASGKVRFYTLGQ